MNDIHNSMVSRLGALLVAAVGLIALSGRPAAAEAGEMEVSGVTGAVRLSDASAFPLTTTPGAFSPGVRFAYGVAEMVDVVAGYQGLIGMQHETDDGVVFKTAVHGLVAGARARLPLVSDWFYAWVQLELEANLAVLDVDLAGRKASQSAWSFGAVPQAGLEVAGHLGEDVAIVTRLGAGYALRMAHDFDAVSATDAEVATRPMDLGSASFGGFVITTSVGLRF
ncbi:MAG: hypothetical protein KC635_13840 [Myxococcales bacterium]|nr:hypothetical protein [Myxococcales bacterium]MCB9734068.1 hypothetical protein [Deltaproteobacteria bacterium]